MKCDLLIFDGRYHLYRTSDAFRDLHIDGPDGPIPTGGIYGFLNVALRVHNRYGGTVAVAWEGETNWRTEAYPSYKDRDKDRSDDAKLLIAEMAEQERRLIRILSAVGVRQYRGVDFEADDVMGRLAAVATERGKSVVIYTGDSDLRQLVDELCLVVSPIVGGGKAKDRVFDAAAVEERHGVPPHLLADLKALAGDSSDRIPGAPGIGAKTAAILLNHYGSLDMVLAAPQSDPDGWPVAQRHVDTVRQHAERLELFRRLTTIRTDAAMKAVPRQRSQRRVVEMLRELKFRSLVGPSELHSLMKMGR